MYYIYVRNAKEGGKETLRRKGRRPLRRKGRRRIS
jgi:hypothetical protein